MQSVFLYGISVVSESYTGLPMKLGIEARNLGRQQHNSTKVVRTTRRGRSLYYGLSCSIQGAVGYVILKYIKTLRQYVGDTVDGILRH